MTHYKVPNNYDSLLVCGDIHGEFKTLIYNIKKFGLEKCAIIIAGDCGIGFEKEEYYSHVYNSIRAVLENRKIMILMIRGNHDDPAYFDGRRIDYPLMKAIPDYSVISIDTTAVLCVGGAISLDRISRKEWMQKRMEHPRKFNSVYWEGERPIIDYIALENIKNSGIRINRVVTHSAPSICAPSLTGLQYHFLLDPYLEHDILQERNTLDLLRNTLLSDKHPVKEWVYGHYHQSKNEYIEDIMYIQLNIHELKQI